MNEKLALRLLRKIMGWDEEVATREYAWVRLAARFKYDGYRDYVAGVRFVESLAGWLNQFDTQDRQFAYAFVKNRILYYSPPEIQRLVEQLYPRFVEPGLRRAVAQERAVPEYLVWANAVTRQDFERKKRQVLFIGLSDGARIDILRRSNAGILANDQVVLATHIDDDKWLDLGKKLREDKTQAGVEKPFFDAIYLVDDFTGSGTSFVRQKKDKSWTGKVVKFWQALSSARGRIEKQGQHFPLAPNFTLNIHHYISSGQAREAIVQRLVEVKAERESNEWFTEVNVTEGLLLPDHVKLNKTTDPDMWAIFDKYYNHDLFEALKEHLEESGQTHIKHGYGNSALPIVLEHNCPNNTVTLVWAETPQSSTGREMRPLFPRRHRHS